MFRLDSGDGETERESGGVKSRALVIVGDQGDMKIEFDVNDRNLIYKRSGGWKRIAHLSKKQLWRRCSKWKVMVITPGAKTATVYDLKRQVQRKIER